MATKLDISTPHGPAQVDLDVPAGRPEALLVLGHGAGGGVEARDLLAVRRAAGKESIAVARVTQPYRVAGRRSPAPAHQLDTAWTAVVEELVARPRLSDLPVVAGGRSSGARVACRTAAGLGVAGVLALSFPLHPPGRPESSRADELLGVEVPVLVVQGEADAFGKPDELPDSVPMVVVPGADHGFGRATAAAVAAAAAEAVAWVRLQVGAGTAAEP